MKRKPDLLERLKQFNDLSDAEKIEARLTWLSQVQSAKREIGGVDAVLYVERCDLRSLDAPVIPKNLVYYAAHGCCPFEG